MSDYSFTSNGVLQLPAEWVVLEGLEGKARSLIQRDLTGWPRQSESQKVWCKRAHAKYGSNDRAVITSARTCLPSGPFAIVHLRLASGAQVYIPSSSTAPQPFFPLPHLSFAHALALYILLPPYRVRIHSRSLPSLLRPQWSRWPHFRRPLWPFFYSCSWVSRSTVRSPGQLPSLQIFLQFQILLTIPQL